PRFRVDSQTSGHGVVEAYSAGGSQLWSYPFAPQEWPESSHVHDAQGLVYVVTSALRLVALDGTSGALAWQKPLPTLGPIYNGVLALTPAGSLVASARRELFGIYAGAGLAQSPWPRFRGENDNRSCPGPQPAPAAP
ncbi:MAG: outer membrane protein assembly factor BamB family protein, partial [Deltaproteobacteria bacterium]